MANELHISAAEMTRKPKSRLDQCYPITTAIDYRLMEGDRVLERGTGQTKAISSTNVWLLSDKALPVGALVHVAIRWPVRLENKVPLKLVIFGHTVFAEGKYTQVEISRYEFRTGSILSENHRPTYATPSPARTLTVSA